MGKAIGIYLENIVGDTHLKTIQDAITSHYFGWYFHSDINYGKSDSNATKIGFVHTFMRDDVIQSDYANLIMPIVWKAIDETGENIKRIIRVKANMTINVNQEETAVPHQDYEPNCDSSWNLWSAIFYPFDVDGDTVFYLHDKRTEVERITPKANTMVLFNSMTFHHGFLPKIAVNRKIINIAFATVPK
jgi:hypothetical protein